MEKTPSSIELEKAASEHPRATFANNVEHAEKERQQILERFPSAAWPTLTLERYALGQEDSRDTWCRWVEFNSPDLGSMKGGSAHKHIIYKHKDKPGWHFPKEYSDEQEAWKAVRTGFVDALKKAAEGDWYAIDDIEILSPGSALLAKTLYIYFPNDVLPIYSRDHLRRFLHLVNADEGETKGAGVVRLNRSLLASLQKYPALEGWKTKELERLLYSWSDPRETRRIVKIAPGEGAEFWDDCREGGYICVGWDDVGDLRDYESKESFVQRLVEQHPKSGAREANRLWGVFELEPGDLIVANKGQSEVLAVGEVVDPGYEWLPDRSSLRHIVHVKWDTSRAKMIPQQKAWRSTIVPVSASLYEIIAGGGDIPPVVSEAIIDEIASALDDKLQVILYGPPGTGKTYVARRFAIFWLLKQLNRDDASKALADRAFLDRMERELMTHQAKRRVWWVVANPKEWSWDQLFKDGKVSYRYGRLQRNYPLVQPDDLVIGYQSTPDKRIVALAKISKGFGVQEGPEPSIELMPVARVSNGLSYDELGADPILSGSEPMRFRNQGTLFALTSDEGTRVLALVAERNADLQPYLETGEGIGSLTLLTFHPSYSYEDFIEGFRPTDTGNGLSLRLEDGIFKRICREAQAQPEKRFLLLIDEINRANVAKVFGEIITLLEADKRGLVVTLPQSKESFCVPRNVYVLGTMNTADRSIRLLDAALRRRFAFIELMPNPALLEGAKVGSLALDTFLERLNERIAHREGREKQVGHSFLLKDGEPVSDPEEFSRRFRQEILPLLQEYCYEDYGTLAEYLGEQLVNKEQRTLKVEVLSDPDALISALDKELGAEKESQPA